MSANPAAFYKALRLGDTARSHPAPTVSLEGVDFAPTVFGTAAAVGERGPGSRVSIEIEPILLRTYSQTTGDIGASETDAAFFGRKLTLANNLRTFAGFVPEYSGGDVTSRLGPLVWIDDPASADKFAVSSYNSGDKNTATLSSASGYAIALGEKFLLVSGNYFCIVTISDPASIGATTLKFTNVPEAQFVSAAAMLRIRWMLDGAAMSGDLRIGEGDKASRVARGGALKFDSVEDFWLRP